MEACKFSTLNRVAVLFIQVLKAMTQWDIEFVG